MAISLGTSAFGGNIMCRHQIPCKLAATGQCDLATPGFLLTAWKGASSIERFFTMPVAMSARSSAHSKGGRRTRGYLRSLVRFGRAIRGRLMPRPTYAAPVSGKTFILVLRCPPHGRGYVSRYSTTQTFRSRKWNTIRQRRLNRVQCAIIPIFAKLRRLHEGAL